MSDYISREAAVKIAQKYGLANGSALGRHTGVADCIAIEIDGLPAADVEPVRRVRFESGEKQYVEEFGWFRWFRCSTCYSGFNITGHPRYCPYCGGKAVFESGPPIPVEHVEVTEEEAEAFFQALETPPKPVYPVRRGRWVNKKGGFFEFAACSLCGEVAPTAGITPNYCPSCGAKMDLEDETNDD